MDIDRKWFQITVELIKEKMEKTEYKSPSNTGKSQQLLVQRI